MRPLPPKITPLIRPDIRCTEMVKEYKISPSREVTPLIRPDIRCTDIVKEYKMSGRDLLMFFSC
jgi:hypothetical protein